MMKLTYDRVMDAYRLNRKDALNNIRSNDYYEAVLRAGACGVLARIMEVEYNEISLRKDAEKLKNTILKNARQIARSNADSCQSELADAGIVPLDLRSAV